MIDGHVTVIQTWSMKRCEFTGKSVETWEKSELDYFSCGAIDADRCDCNSEEIVIRKMNYSQNELARNEKEEWYVYLIWFARFLLPE